MDLFKVALLQLLPPASMGEILETGLQACRKAKEMGADLAVFPELWQIGYDQRCMTPDYAIGQGDPFIQQYIAIAQELKLAIALSYVGHGSVKPRNKVLIIDSSGKIILDYAKVHICDFAGGTETSLEAGDDFKVATLAYGDKEVRLGAMICFDREFPESGRVLMVMGAELIIIPNSFRFYSPTSVGDYRMSVIRTRAFENMMGIVMVNYASPKDDGHSCVFTANGDMLYAAGTAEEITLCDIDLDFIRQYRKKELYQFNRRPTAYRGIVS